jgi:hypothetical protein
LAHVKAPPPSQPLAAEGSLMGLLLASQVPTGELTGALSGQEHEGLQQSQYRVVRPEPEAWDSAGLTATASVVSSLRREVDGMVGDLQLRRVVESHREFLDGVYRHCYICVRFAAHCLFNQLATSLLIIILIEELK